MPENYEFVQKGIRILQPLMVRYICQEFKRVYEDNWWRQALEALFRPDELPESVSEDYLIKSLDFLNCLRLIDRRWAEVFKTKLSLDYRTWSKELIGVRNNAAHIPSQDFTPRYAERALDTMALLCEAFDAEGVQEIRALYRKVRYGSEGGSTVTPGASGPGRVRSNAGVMTGKIGLNLPSWREVMRPHPDVAEGRYRTAEFAADLAQVARGEGSIEYRDPVEFFARTYVTEGMAGLLVESLQRLSGKGGEPVIQLKTAFGGGKTHSLLALYHMVRGGISPSLVPSLKPIMERAGVDSLPKANVAVLVGTALDPAHKKNPANLPKYAVNTLWGEMAYQLVTSAGKPELYAIISDSDRRSVSPGSETLKKLLDACGPCLILMDEIVAYAKKLYGVLGLPAGSYDNLITFIQEITEAARASKNSIVVASIPESDIEIGGEAGKKAADNIEHTFARVQSDEKSEEESEKGKKVLNSIEHTFGRMESVWKPVAASEGFEVVRRRLFLDCRDPETRDRVCSAFSRMYQENSADFPTEAKEVEYRNRMISCYPIHPEIFDRLYGDWSTLEKFQRTRGVLRLMAAVIYELWMANDSSAMIMPGSLPLNVSSVREELKRYLPEAWNSIIDREVDGKNSVPYQKDTQTTRYGEQMAARRVARTIMLGSAPSMSALRDGSIRGLETSRIRLGIVQPGENIAVFNDALNTLHGALSYLYTNQNGTRFWYDTKPTLRKTSEDRASQVADDDVIMEIESRLRKLRRESPLSGLHICPASSNDIPDEQSARLVILRPEDTYQRVKGQDCGKAMTAVADYMNTRGNSPRVYKNMLSFVAPDSEQFRALQTEVKRYIAWKSIVDDKEDLNLDIGQFREALNSQDRSNHSVDTRIRETYCWLLIPSVDPDIDIKTTQWEVTNLGGGDDGIISKAVKKMVQAEVIITSWAPRALQMCLNQWLWKNSDHIEIKKLWENLCSYCYLPKLADVEVLKTAILNGVNSKEFFGLAAGFERGRYIDLKFNEPASSVNLSDWLVQPAVAQKQKEEEQPKPPVSVENGSGGTGGSGTDNQGGQTLPSEITGRHGGGSVVAPAPKKTRFFMSVKLDNTRVNKEINAYLTEIIQHLNSVPGAEADLTLEVSVCAEDGFPASIMRTVSENCRTLKVKEFSFEDQ